MIKLEVSPMKRKKSETKGKGVNSLNDAQINRSCRLHTNNNKNTISLV